MSILRSQPPSRASRLPLLAVRVVLWLLKEDKGIDMRYLIIAVVAGVFSVGTMLLLPIIAEGGNHDHLVTLCHYDRNDQGPNAGPHTIQVDAHAVDHHLTNHTRTNDYMGDDHLGECEDDSTPTSTPSSTPTETPTSTETATPTNTPTSSPTSVPTSSATSTVTNTPTDTIVPTSTPTTLPTTTATPFISELSPPVVREATTTSRSCVEDEVAVGDECIHIDALPQSGIVLEAGELADNYALGQIIGFIVGLIILTIGVLVYWWRD